MLLAQTSIRSSAAYFHRLFLSTLRKGSANLLPDRDLPNEFIHGGHIHLTIWFNIICTALLEYADAFSPLIEDHGQDTAFLCSIDIAGTQSLFVLLSCWRARARDIIGFAGVWSPWKNPKTDQWEDTFSVFTTDPNAKMKPIHDRQPVILEPRDYEEWLAPTERPPVHLLRVLPEEEIELHLVNPAFIEPPCVMPTQGGLFG
jgi:hypothetical protein